MVKPICRQFVLTGKCHIMHRCIYDHPSTINENIKRKARRSIGCCHCGSSLKRVMNQTSFKLDSNGTLRPIFYVLCSRTNKSMKKCENIIIQ